MVELYNEQQQHEFQHKGHQVLLGSAFIVLVLYSWSKVQLRLKTNAYWNVASKYFKFLKYWVYVLKQVAIGQYKSAYMYPTKTLWKSQCLNLYQSPLCTLFVID